MSMGACVLVTLSYVGEWVYVALSARIQPLQAPTTPQTHDLLEFSCTALTAPKERHGLAKVPQLQFEVPRGVHAVCGRSGVRERWQDVQVGPSLGQSLQGLLPGRGSSCLDGKHSGASGGGIGEKGPQWQGT